MTKLIDLFIVDAQIHFTQQDTKLVVDNYIKYIKQNLHKIENINLIIDLTHENKFNSDQMWDYTNDESVEDLYDLQENNPDIFKEVYEFVSEYRLPIELAKFLIVLKNSGHIKLNKIFKTYFKYRNIIDYKIEIAPITLKLIFELNKIGIDNETVSYTELEEVKETHTCIGNIINKIIAIADNEIFDIYELISFLNEARISCDKEIINYENLLRSNSNDIIFSGGAVRECLSEELGIATCVCDILKINKNIIVDNNLNFGNIDNYNLNNLQKDTIRYFKEVNTVNVSKVKKTKKNNN